MRRTLAVLAAGLMTAGMLAAAARAEGEAAEKGEKVEAKTEAKADAAKMPEFLEFTKTKKMAPVKFPHALHAKMLKGCAACHEGEKPLFEKKFDDKGILMKDIYKGEYCGACHNGKKEVDGKKVFKAMTSCVKCHPKPKS
ncbi:MAG: hypothetical protein KGL53_06950 [Elusimicrobia bacterium]|nr:hypothetical protein [Elusimicrobiota bacterium]